MYKYFFKRIFDFTIALFALIILSPIILVITVVLAIDFKGNPFFTQSRPELNGKIFRLIKFKTMTDKTDVNGNLLPDKKRITRVGKFLRSTSLDELPQLINIIKGEMSIIGPRPLKVEYLELYNCEQARRHEIKPGITGWAQINGRNSISWEQKFKYDVWYVDNYSFFLDLKILFLTVIKVVNRTGINQSLDLPMEKFKGTKTK